MPAPFSTDTIEAAQRAARAGEMNKAEAICRRLIKKNRRDVSAVGLLSAILLAQTRFEEAATSAKKAISLAPKEARFHSDLAQARALQGRYDEAIRGFDKSLKIDPHDTATIARRADALHRRGDESDALAFLEENISSGREDPLIADAQSRLLHAAGRFDEAITVADRWAHGEDLSYKTARSLLSVLAKSLEKVGRYDEAFAAYTKCHQAMEAPFDARGHVQFADALINIFSKDALPSLPHAANESELPIFIVGMPRSGSTLTEQIIHAHPKAHGAGELMIIDEIANGLMAEIGAFELYPKCIRTLVQPEVDAIGGRLLDTLAAYDRSADRIVDKQLLNYKHIGFIELLAPRARIIHCRRDPLDTCFSCYTTNLSPLLHPYTTSLESLGLVYRQYARLMAHWLAVTSLPVLEVDYEELVADQETVSRTIIEFCGLDWDDACLRFYEAKRAVLTASLDQVNKPIYTSAVGRAGRFESHLGPLRAALADDR